MTKEFGKGFDRRNLWFMRSFYVSFEIVNAARSQSSPGSKSHAVRGELPIIPPLAEQRGIVAYLDNFNAKVGSLKRLQAETTAELNAMLPSILDKAFKGVL